ncbi:MAG: hypothetical protein IRY99_09310 [Isosphaeraceae bacterium]|nr:hypothetical protein [Isosphaeraceae bacterium]
MSVPIQLYVPGPVQIYTGSPGVETLSLLGISEANVELTLDPRFVPVRTSLSGPEIPIDEQFMGETGSIAATLSAYNETQLQQLLARLAGTVAGSLPANMMGSLMIAEGHAYPLVLFCPYGAKTIYGDMVKGWRFPAAYLVDSFSVELSTEVKRPRVIFRALPAWNVEIGSYLLYDNNVGVI